MRRPKAPALRDVSEDVLVEYVYGKHLDGNGQVIVTLDGQQVTRHMRGGYVVVGRGMKALVRGLQ